MLGFFFFSIWFGAGQAAFVSRRVQEQIWIPSLATKEKKTVFFLSLSDSPLLPVARDAESISRQSLSSYHSSDTPQIRSHAIHLSTAFLDSSMARVDAVRSGSSSWCSATTVAVFVGLCLVGVWMASSALVSPAEFSPFQPAPLWAGDAAPAEGNAAADVVVVSEDEKDAVAEPTERANRPPDEQTKVEKPGGEQIATELKQDQDQEPESKRDAEVFPDASQAELLNQTATDRPLPWRTQAAMSDIDTNGKEQANTTTAHDWRLCDTEAGADYIPCLDNVEVIRKLQHDEHYEHRERHCPEENPTCLVPLPKGYRSPIRWPKSRDQVGEVSFSVC